ncbi:hypothetical protein L207DRAFT_560408 [Hyaloscypha variabilis F]|uniref:Uncharacterized protein n=1 Tax=Hyaloscypha variabilis (strain UAMH 11265 / GT02V1 / F) TaxID=1149755 RepID=A0A2J6SDK3_HYAVF|nr:hypothetical protein L207DRAFT_560408 [Hyaloscypha variabilis F]
MAATNSNGGANGKTSSVLSHMKNELHIQRQKLVTHYQGQRHVPSLADSESSNVENQTPTRRHLQHTSISNSSRPRDAKLYDSYLEWLNDCPTLPTNNIPPVDVLGVEELDFLKLAIKNQHWDGIADLADPEEDWTRQWSNILAEAACHDERIQKILVDKRLSPGNSGLDGLKFNPLWVLGIPLPGSYDDPLALGSIEDIMTVVDKLTPTILQSVEKQIDIAIEATISQFQNKTGDVDYKSLVPAACPTKETVQLLQIVRSDLEREEEDIDSRRVLNNLKGMPNLPSCGNLAQLLDFELDTPGNPLSSPNSRTLHDFTTESISYLRNLQKDWMVLQPLPDLTASDMSAIENPHYHHEHDPDEWEDEDDELAAYLEATAQISDAEVFEMVPLYRRLFIRIKSRLPRPKPYRQWGWPVAGALSTFSPSAAEEVAWHPSQPVWEKKRMSIESGYLPAESIEVSERNHLGGSAQVPESIESDHVRDRVLGHMKRTISSRTLDEVAFFEGACQNLISVSCRPAGFERLHNQNKLFLVANPGLTQDNWWHCRRLLQMTQSRTPIAESEHNRYELDLVLVLSAILGSYDPIPWLITLDGLLRCISTGYVTSFDGDSTERGIQTRLLQELKGFAHAVAVTALEARFGSSRNFPNNTLPVSRKKTSWYSMFYQLYPNCANSSCLRELPNPLSVFFDMVQFGSIKKARAEQLSNDYYSISTRESRIGYPSVRSFISTNRNFAYACLSGWVNSRNSHPALIVALYWFCEILHIDCKAARGKWPTQF